MTYAVIWEEHGHERIKSFSDVEAMKAQLAELNDAAIVPEIVEEEE